MVTKSHRDEVLWEQWLIWTRYLPTSCPQTLHYNLVHTYITTSCPQTLHYNLVHTDALHYNLVPTGAFYYNLVPTGAIHYNLVPTDALHYNLVPNDVTANLVPQLRYQPAVWYRVEVGYAWGQ